MRSSAVHRLTSSLVWQHCVGYERGRRRTDREPNRGWVPAGMLALVVALTDWLVKVWVARRLPLSEYEILWEGRVALWHVRNDAMVLGLYGDLPLAGRQVIAVTCAVLGGFLLFELMKHGHRLPSRQRPWVWTFVGLSTGGMLGNLGERAVHWGVTDYLSLHWGGYWLPPGNIADLAIFLSIPFALVGIWFEVQARTRRAGAAGATLGGAFTADSAPTGS
jgi:signal peptidase II